MDTLNAYRQRIQALIAEHAAIPHAHGDICSVTVFDEENDHYLLLSTGWEGDKHVHGCLIHVDIIDGKFWIQYDGTEYGIANELVDAGVPRERIVLGFHPPDVRPHTEFAAA